RRAAFPFNLLVEWTTAEAQVEALTVPVLHGIDHLLRHADGEGEVAAHLPHHDGGADVLCLDLDVLPRHLLSDLQAVGSVLVPTVLGAVSKGSGELVHLRLVHFLVHALLEALENDGELAGGGKEEKKGRGLQPVLTTQEHTATPRIGVGGGGAVCSTQPGAQPSSWVNTSS
uniref:Uncharacterized protein n=1 Tax=Anas zonorhyncha TaxID=75864 RepID=A0A8B9VNK8_9AVES